MLNGTDPHPIICTIAHALTSHNTYFGPQNILGIVYILAHSSSESITARAWWILFPIDTTPWFLIMSALTCSSPFSSFFLSPSKAFKTVFASSIDPDGLFGIITGFPTIILASSIMCWNSFTGIATASVKDY